MNRDTLTRILDLARWAPSGDNTQPWQFEIVNDHLIRIYGNDTRDHILYDFEGHPSHIAHGALLETIRIAATKFGLTTKWTAHSEAEDRFPIYDVALSADAAIEPDALVEFIESRTVQRRPMRTTPLTNIQRQALINAGGEHFSIDLFETWAERGAIAKLLWDSAKIRLTCPEAYPVHKQIIEWGARFSKDRIPEQAVGVDPATAHLMKWVMQSWERVNFFNRYMLGTVAPRIQLDLLPGLLCSAHLMVKPKQQSKTLTDWIQLGIAVQRIWLTATSLGLHLQPEMTPVIFRWYARSERSFSEDPTLFARALKISDDIERLACIKLDGDVGFLARVGTSTVPQSRSIRHDLATLMKV